MAVRGADQRLDVLRGIGRTLRQVAHLLGDDGETAAGLSRAGGFDAGIQRQQVGLEGDLVDQAHDVGNTMGAVLDLLHGRHGGTDRSEEHTSELQSLMRISYAVFCLKKKKQISKNTSSHRNPSK